MNIYHPEKLPPLPEPDMAHEAARDDRSMEFSYSEEAMRAYAAAAVADLQAQVKQLQDTLALQKRSYEREIELEVAAERERCAKLCDQLRMPAWVEARGDVRDALAEAIRAGDTAP